MCGINGFTWNDQRLIERMDRATGHRGPDQTRFWVGESISLGHNRLSIIDLSENANQPMWDAAGECAIVFNGEIYNFQELRRTLEGTYAFRSQSDTEVILNAYKEYGRECVKYLNGIFAFAIWDRRDGSLFLARDRMGVKPLYYFFDGSRFIFSSEIKAILAHDVPRAVDRTAFDLFFHVLYTPEPHTMFAHIRKLPAACTLTVRDRKLDLKKYWEIDDMTDLPSRLDATRRLHELFRDAVRRQLVSDRPVGIFLSGGMDSTAVLGAVVEASAERTKTFSVGFETPVQVEKFNADFLLARETAAYFGTDHHELLLSGRDMAEHLDAIVWHMDEPNSNPTAGAIFLLSRLAKQDVAVVLGGDGGDELFGGYPRYHSSALISAFQRQLGFVRGSVEWALRVSGRQRLLALAHLPPDERRILAFLALKPTLLQEALHPDFYSSGATAAHFHETYFSTLWDDPSDFEKRFMHVDRQSWLVDESLMRTDKMTMAWGLEERVPLLDHRIVELAARIPTSWKISRLLQRPSHFQGKRILRDAVSVYLPPHIRNQRKRGWFTPMSKWLRTELKERASDVLSPSHLNSDFFDVQGVQRIWKEHLDGTRYNFPILWAIIAWQLWYDRFIRNGESARTIV